MRHFVFTALMVLVVVVGVSAQDTAIVRHTRLDSMQYIKDVVVYGTKPYKEVIPAQILSGKQLEGLNSHSVADAIRYFAGVQLKDYGGVGGIKTVDMRSMGTNHMGVFYDGIQLGNAQNGQIDLGRYSLDNIEEISLYNGQKSDIFQSARDYGSAGTVYIRTRQPKFKANKRDNLNVTMRTGSFGLANPSFRWEHKFNSHVSMALNTEYTYATGQYHFRYRKMFSDGVVAWDTTAVRKNGDIGALRVEGALFGVMTDGRWHAKAYYYDSERGIPGAIVNNVWHNSQRQWDRNFFTQGTFQKRVNDRYELMFNAKYAHDYMRYLNPDTTLMYINNRFYQHEAYVSTAHKYTLVTDWDVNVGVDYQWNYLKSTLVNFSYPTRHTLLTVLATAYTWHRIKGQASLLYTHVTDLYTSRSGDQVLAHHRRGLDKWTPAIFLSYQPWQEHDLNVRAYYKRIFRMPTFNDLYYTDIGNAALRPEYATQYNVGILYNLYREEGWLSALRLSADAYYNEVTDKIVAVPKGTGQYRWMMMNIGLVHIRGIDATARVAMRFPLGIKGDVNLSYTYQRAQDYTNPADDEDGGTYKGQIAYVPWHSGSVAAHVAWRDVDVNYSFIYVGERYHTSANIRANHEQPWYTHDLSASYLFKVGNARLKVTAEVNNLLNQSYDVIQNYPMPGRNYKLIVRFDI
ncbi:MAG: TonB-dependent receptor [Muribaculaceae bacterium]|nr:TonB-dependent receptor [Muribaculaceae bacterium]